MMKRKTLPGFRRILAVMIMLLNAIAVIGRDVPASNETLTLHDPLSGKTASLPPEVTNELLYSLTDENGNLLATQDQPSNEYEDPEGDAMSLSSFNGFGLQDQFGYSVSGAGDVNGDGYDDIIVGARYNDAAGSNAGRAYIYFGGVNMNVGVDVTLTGEIATSYFGTCVSTAGDVNGDGYDDVMVGASGYSASTGRAYIYFGGPSMNNVADVIMTGQSTNNNFGESVSPAGDVNGDGYSDVIAGAYTYSSNTGRAYIYFGGIAMNNSADVTITGEAVANFFGGSVSSAGDFNGDGYDDVTVGAEAYSSSTGRAYVFFGGASMNTVADLTFTGEATGNLLGVSVSGAGDVNGDGYSDVIFGAEGYSGSTGRAYILFGGASADNIADVILTGEAAGNRFGRSVAGAGDINGDGFTDVIAGADAYSSSSGRSYVYYGHTLMNNVADFTFTGEATSSFFGRFVSAAGDVNGDGYADMAAGSYGYNSQTGRVYIYSNAMKGEDIADLIPAGQNTTDRFGSSVSGAGDVNGDGFDDMIIAAAEFGSSNTGRVYIYYGGENMNTVPDVTMTFDSTGQLFGTSVSSAGDVNADGYDDVVIGVKDYNPDGAAIVYFGGATMDSIPDLTLLGETAGAVFGTSVSSAGDVNADGFSDVVVGDPSYGPNIGRAYIFYGGLTMNSTVDVTLSADDSSNFGGAVSSAGDVNNDGYSDVLIGAPTNDAVATNAGRAYIFYGGASMNSSADITMSGETSSDEFGDVLSSAGDFNRDGYDDVIIGGTFSSRAYIFYGGFSMNNTADLILYDSISSRFGCGVSDAGDVNLDGFSDVIVGADNIDAFTGRAYIFFGGTSPDILPDVIMNGDTVSEYMGNVVSDAGDLNGDGFADVLSSAPIYNSFRGRVYTYLSSPPSVKPILNCVRDVPNDQGGRVNLKWAKSGYDVPLQNMITTYSIFRSFPPSGGNFSWQEVATVTARALSFYSYIDNTPYDSTTGNSATLFYRIRANTANTQNYWESAILSGRSIDNIAPLMVSPFSASSVASNVQLVWNRSTAPDILYYVLYRSTSPVIDPDTEPVFASTTDSTFLDTAPLGGVYYYFIVAQDIHNNKSPLAIAESPGMTLNLTMFIEGMYNAGSNAQVSDSITVELRNASSPFAVADVAKAVAGTSGSAVLKFASAPNGNYYIAVRHRNALETWSATALTLSRTTPASYDLSSSPAQAFGGNIIQADSSPLRFAVYSGDVNQDGTVDATDVSTIDNDAANFVSGYVVTDLTGDNFVDGTDFAIADNNAANFVSVVRP